MGNFTYRARIRNWGQDAYIFRLSEDIIRNIQLSMMLEEYDRVLPQTDSFRLSEAESMAEALLADGSKESMVTFAFGSGDSDGDTKFAGLGIPSKDSASPDELEGIRQLLKAACVLAVQSASEITCGRFSKNGKAEVFGLVTDENGAWWPLRKEDMSDMRTLVPDGTGMPPENGVTYTEIKRRK